MVDYGAAETGTGAASSSRFVCPNDRQLALRAKLKTGWSVKTGSLGGSCGSSGSANCKTSPVNPLRDEEQEAIIEVIHRAERLEMLEQERVGRLVERLENLRRNALGKSPTQCLLCGERFGLLGAQRVRCVDCRKFVCQKCSIDANSLKSKRSAGKITTHQWLCMICSETREVWKKSGAWFFKSLPKYALPNQYSGGYPAGKRRSKRSGSRKEATVKYDDSSSDDDRKSWTAGKFNTQRRSSNTESTQDDIATLQEAAKTYGRQASTIDFAGVPEMPSKQFSTLTLDELKSWDLPECSADDVKFDRISANGSQTSRDSFATRSVSELNWNESRSEENRSSSVCSLTSGIFKEDGRRGHPGESGNCMGTMELSLAYDPVNLTLHCAIYRAKNLVPMDINGLADPFCKLNILPDGKSYTRLRTKTVHKTRNPEFNENVTFYEIDEDDLSKKSLHVLILDDDKYGHDYMGEARIPLLKLRIQNTIYLRVALEKFGFEQKGPLPSPDLTQWFDDDLWSRGQILLSLCYSTKKRALLVGVIKCANLLPMDNNGFSDPFVKLHLRPDPCHKKHKTTIKWKNLNPVFNEEFAFETRPTELATQCLYITVWDKDYGKSNDYLGGLIIGGHGSKGQRLKHWLDMIKYPDHRHEYWHNLTEVQID